MKKNPIAAARGSDKVTPWLPGRFLPNRLTTILKPFGWLYGKITNTRNALYDRGIFESHSLGARTISIGNITAGGTGKTPLVAFVAELLAEQGERVCILTRGYGRENPRSRVLVSDGEKILADVRRAGDEPFELAQKLIGKALVIADADRISAAKWALNKFGVTVFVLDDAFQNRKVKRDLDIICIDATNPFGNGKMLPAGILREPLKNLKRANAIVITRANLTENVENLKSQISKLNPLSLIFLMENRIAGLRALEDFHAKPQRSQTGPEKPADELGWNQLRSKKADPAVNDEVRVTAFCALGNPYNFFIQVMAAFDEDWMEEFDLSIIRPFPDHHFYTQKNIDALQKQANECNIDALVTTAKDAVKLKDLKFEIPCYVIEIEATIKDEKSIRDLIIAS